MRVPRRLLIAGARVQRESRSNNRVDALDSTLFHRSCRRLIETRTVARSREEEREEGSRLIRHQRRDSIYAHRIRLHFVLLTIRQ